MDSSFSSLPYHPAYVDPAGDLTPGSDASSAPRDALDSAPGTDFIAPPGHVGELSERWPAMVFEGGTPVQMTRFAPQAVAQEQYPQRGWVMPWDLLQPPEDVFSGDASPYDPTPSATSSATSPPESPPAPDVMPFFFAHSPLEHAYFQPAVTVASANGVEHAMLPGLLPLHDAVDYEPEMPVQPQFDGFDSAPIPHGPYRYEASYTTGAALTNVDLAPEHAPVTSVAATPTASPVTIDLTTDSDALAHTETALEALLPPADDYGAQSQYTPLPGSRRLPARALELRVISELEMYVAFISIPPSKWRVDPTCCRARLTSSERRRIYIASMEKHIDRLYTAALAVGRYECNRDRIAQLSGLDAKELKVATTHILEEIERLRDRRDALRAKVCARCRLRIRADA